MSVLLLLLDEINERQKPNRQSQPLSDETKMADEVNERTKRRPRRIPLHLNVLHERSLSTRLDVTLAACSPLLCTSNLFSGHDSIVLNAQHWRSAHIAWGRARSCHDKRLVLHRFIRWYWPETIHSSLRRVRQFIFTSELAVLQRTARKILF